MNISEKNKEILIAMRNGGVGCQLHRPIQKVTFLPPAQEPEIASQKQSIVDVLCCDEDGCKYIVEMLPTDVCPFGKLTDPPLSFSDISHSQQ